MTLDTFRLIEKCIFHGSVESCCKEISFVNAEVFLKFFVSLFIFPVLISSTSSESISQISFFKTSRSYLTFQPFNLAILIQYKTIIDKATKVHLKTLMNQTINIRECSQVFLTRLSDFMIAIKVLLTKLYICLRFLCLILNVLKMQNFMRIFVSCFDKVE